MNTLYSPYFKARLFVILFMTMLSLSACSRKMNFQGSSIVPAAEGYAKIKKDNNNNYSIRVTVKNLAAPDKLQTPKNLYVVWAENENGTSKNIGQITTSSGMFSKALKASLKAVTPFKPTQIYITAEDNADIRNPGGFVVLNTKSP